MAHGDFEAMPLSLKTRPDGSEHIVVIPTGGQIVEGGGQIPAAGKISEMTDGERQMVTDNLGLVHHIVARVIQRFPSDYGRDDMVQVGTLGLIEATRRFDPERGTRFSTFAGRRIEGAITDYLRSNDWAPRSVRSQRRVLAMAEAQGATTDQEVSRLSGLDPSVVRRVRADVERARLDSFERRVDAGIDVGNKEQGIDSDLLHREAVGELRSALHRLPPRQRILVEAHFLDGRTLTEIGEAMGITQSRASQLKAEALTTMRRLLAPATS